MAAIVVAGDAPNAGATTIAVGLAHRLAYAGHSVDVSRLEGDERAAGDAGAFALLDFASSPGQPVAASAILAGGEGVAVIEAPAGSDAIAVARDLGATLVLVRAQDERGGAEDAPAGATVIANHAQRGGALLIPRIACLRRPPSAASSRRAGLKCSRAPSRVTRRSASTSWPAPSPRTRTNALRALRS